MVVQCFKLRFTKVTDIVHLRILSGNEYVHVNMFMLKFMLYLAVGGHVSRIY